MRGNETVGLDHDACKAINRNNTNSLNAPPQQCWSKSFPIILNYSKVEASKIWVAIGVVRRSYQCRWGVPSLRDYSSDFHSNYPISFLRPNSYKPCKSEITAEAPAIPCCIGFSSEISFHTNLQFQNIFPLPRHFVPSYWRSVG